MWTPDTAACGADQAQRKARTCGVSWSPSRVTSSPRSVNKLRTSDAISDNAMSRPSTAIPIHSCGSKSTCELLLPTTKLDAHTQQPSTADSLRRRARTRCVNVYQVPSVICTMLSRKARWQSVDGAVEIRRQIRKHSNSGMVGAFPPLTCCANLGLHPYDK